METRQFSSRLVILALTLTASLMAQPAAAPTAWQALDEGSYEHWTGLEKTPNGVVLALPGAAVYRAPDGPLGWHLPTDYEAEHDGVIDLRPWYGLRFEVETDRDDAPLMVDLALDLVSGQQRHNLLEHSAATRQLQGGGWQAVTVPFASFDYNRGQIHFLKFIKTITLAGRYADGTKGVLRLRHVRLVRANGLQLSAAVRSRAAAPGAGVDYEVAVTNCADTAQVVTLGQERSGWEAMTTEISPSTLVLPPGASGTATVRVTVPADAPPGGRETQTLLATPQGGSGEQAKLELITIRRVPFPFLVHDAAGWEEVRAKVAKYDWAKAELAGIVEKADRWEVPEPYVNNRAPDGTRSVFKSYIENDFSRVGLAYRLTGEKKYAEKIALFLRRLADPAKGYPRTRHANSQGIPQEGGFFRGCVEAYDAIYNSGALSDVDKQQIEQTFRLYIGVVEDGMGDGGISNWSVFNLAPAAMCALAVHDLAHYDYLVNGPCGLADHLRYGMMSDGWWYEMSLSYNLGCAEEFTRLGLAARRFGLDLLERQFPVALTSKVGLRPFEFENFLGMAFGKYGPLQRSTATIKQLWDGIALYPDYRGVMFGMGDGHEQVVSGGPFELAYYAFRDPAYAGIIKRGGKRDLVYSVAELPPEPPELDRQSGHSDNAGIAVLRSQTPGREPREQIQAAFKYGTHGSYHGHFDRLSLLSLMRYGRSFYNPETSWFGYGSYMYKWWVQPSVAHNMVVVDGKQQEPQPSLPLLFHSGPMLQVIAAENVSRWSNPPYFGGYDQLAKVKAGDAPFVAIPDKHPKPGDVTDYTEPVRQRRMIIVTDDYVLIADALRGDHEHIFDQQLHLRGARLAEPAKLKFLGHAAQFDASPLSSGQFITNIDRYAAKTPVLVRSIHRIGEGKNWETGGAKSLSVPGVLQIDAHVLWPQSVEIAFGDFPESWNTGKKLTYEVKGDGRALARGTFGAWNLGSGEVDVDVRSVKALRLTTQTARGSNARNTLFWGGAMVVTADGKTIPLAELRTTTANIISPPTAGRDYEGGPIRIAGIGYEQAVPAEPQDAGAAGVITVDLTGANAVRFQATVGADWPVGEEEQLRKTVTVRTVGKTARFLTLIEPYESTSVVKSAIAFSPDTVRVELADGRVQDLALTGFADGPDVVVTLVESKLGVETRRETTVDK